MAKPDSTTPPSQSTSNSIPAAWALICSSHLNGATSALLLAIETVPCLELRAALCSVLIEVAKLWGVFEYLGEGLLVVAEGGAE